MSKAITQTGDFGYWFDEESAELTVKQEAYERLIELTRAEVIDRKGKDWNSNTPLDIAHYAGEIIVNDVLNYQIQELSSTVSEILRNERAEEENA